MNISLTFLELNCSQLPDLQFIRAQARDFIWAILRICNPGSFIINFLIVLEFGGFLKCLNSFLSKHKWSLLQGVILFFVWFSFTHFRAATRVLCADCEVEGPASAVEETS